MALTQLIVRKNAGHPSCFYQKRSSCCCSSICLQKETILKVIQLFLNASVPDALPVFLSAANVLISYCCSIYTSLCQILQEDETELLKLRQSKHLVTLRERVFFPLLYMHFKLMYLRIYHNSPEVLDLCIQILVSKICKTRVCNGAVSKCCIWTFFGAKIDS